MSKNKIKQTNTIYFGYFNFNNVRKLGLKFVYIIKYVFKQITYAFEMRRLK